MVGENTNHVQRMKLLQRWNHSLICGVIPGECRNYNDIIIYTRPGIPFKSAELY